MKAIYASILSLAALSFSFASNPAVSTKGKILDYGEFKLLGPQQNIANPSTLDGREQNGPAAQFSSQTDRVPATLGVQFGFRYKITGVTEINQADFKFIVTHPPIKNEKGEIEREYTVHESLPVHDGVVSETTGYSLDRPEELVPGIWKFEMWYHDHPLLTQSFTVYSPTKKP
ncbi:hypothetical protein BH09VER1_BH09VER1_40780 [soil metagenome]